MENDNQGQDNHYRCQCCYKKQNHKRASILGERTKEK